ncbi:MAG: preprotein translocase subunit SecF [Mycobacterium sp.]|jgi:preprotein translocase subunit SecF|nr:preprotein translocase subunit SecF [Mycobacterium sp.]
MAADKATGTKNTTAGDVPESAEALESTAVEEGAIDSAAVPHHGFFTRLYTGTGAFEVVGRRRMWFAISGLIVVIAIASIAIRGFTLGIDFQGGTQVSFPRGAATTDRVAAVFRDTLGHDPGQVVIVGNGASATVQVRAETLSNDQTDKLREALFEAFHPVGADGKPSAKAISDSGVSSTWGGQITKKALIALAVFLVLVTLYITIRYERYMAASALAALGFDLLTTAGVYSLVGFEVSPATVIGLLTILGFSLYDTVIVFDKVEENTHGFQHTTRRTFAEQANLAINQTFMRSINTSLISVIPVLALIIVAVWLLGVGTLKDLALVQLVGIIVGTYSSIFLATPLLVTLREQTELVKTHTRRVLRRRKPGETAENADEAASLPDKPTDKPTDDEEPSGRHAVAVAAAKPAPGARPIRPAAKTTGRPSGKRNTRRS